MPHGLSVFPPPCRLSSECPRSSHPSIRRTPPRSSFASNTARNLSTRAHLPGVSALVTTSPACVHQTLSIPLSASFRPQALSTSRRFTPQVGLQVCCAPQPCSGPFLFRGFSLRAAVLLRQKPLPPCRWRRAAHWSPSVHSYVASASRL